MTTQKKDPAARNMSGHRAISPDEKTYVNTFDGRLVSISGDTLVMTCSEGARYTYTVAKDAKLSRDHVPCNGYDFLAGARIRVTTDKDERRLVRVVEGLQDKKEFASHS